MTVKTIFQKSEMQFWKMLTPMMGEKGFLMKVVEFLRKIFRSRIGYFGLLAVIWASIGFLSGVVLGRVIWMVQLY
jgi:hypothetical protein